MQELDSVVSQKGEGLMIQRPGSSYEPGRGSAILKLKPFKDAEAVVVGHKPGKGKHKGVLGALTVRMPDGKTFDVGSGLKDSDRRSPPRIGAAITYRYTELTDGGIPKCGSFVAVRDYE
jgi:DNA ligase-1